MVLGYMFKWTKVIDGENEEIRRNVKDHEYRGGAYTPLDKMMNGFWAKCASIVPRRVSPNVLTLTATVIGYSGLIAILLQPDNPQSYLYAALSIFLYQLFDGMDGKHARNLNFTNPLGAVFDHGCDAMIMPVMGLMLTSCMFPEVLVHKAKVDDIGAGTVTGETLIFGGPFGIAGLSMVTTLTAFWVSIWESILTGTLQHMGVTESQFLAIGITLITGLKGPDFWKFKIGSLQYREIVAVMLLVIASTVTVSSLFRGFKKQPTVRSLVALTPGILLFTSGFLSLTLSELITENTPLFFAALVAAYWATVVVAVSGNVADFQATPQATAAIFPYTVAVLSTVIFGYNLYTKYVHTAVVIYDLIGVVMVVTRSCQGLCNILNVPLLTVPQEVQVRRD